MVDGKTILTIIKHGSKVVLKGAVKHAPTILTGVGTALVIGSVIFTAEKAPDAKQELDEARQEWEEIPDKEKRNKADYIFKLVRIGVKHYWMVALLVGGSITCFWVANRVSLKRLTSALTAAGLSAKAKEELENKIKELDGDKHLKKLKDEIDADTIKNNPPVEGQIYDTGLGMHLCYEPVTGRYFYSNIEKIKQSILQIREYLQKDGYISLNDWFDELGLSSTECGRFLCWSARNFEEVNDFDISFSSVLSPNNVPVLVIQYDVPPIMDRSDW